MKKNLSLLITMILIMCNIFACSNSNIQQNVSATKNNQNEKKLQIVTTIFPAYDWVMSILKNNNNAEVTMLLDNGVDLHNYQPTANDTLKISNCDLFIYVGGESDKWVASALEKSTNNNMQVINLIEALGDKAKYEEIIEGMETEHEHEHENEEENEEEHEHEIEIDEHVWLSLKNASVLCEIITKSLCSIDAENKSLYESNFNEYKTKLDALDKQYKDVVNQTSNKTLLFGDRFPFRYMIDDYGLKYYAAFQGCFAETEASFETMAFLTKKLDENDLKYVMKLEGNSSKLAQTIIDNSNNKNREILSLNSMQSITSNDVGNGANYIDIMTKNLEVLKQALQ